MPDKLRVMVKDGTSYVETGGRNLLINGQEAAVCKGNSLWRQVEGPIESIVAVHTPSPKVLKFVLKEEHKALLSSLPAECSPGTFERDWDEDCGWSGEYAAFYEPVYDDPQPVHTPLEFEVIDLNCEPVLIPTYVKVEFPACVSEHRCTWHKYPCSIDSSQVFRLLYDEVEKVVAAHPDRFFKDDFRSIETCRVQQRVLIPAPVRKTRQEDYYPTFRSRKTKTRTVVDTIKNVEVMHFVGSYKNDKGAVQVISVHGKDYAELQVNLASYIRSFTDKLDPTMRAVCHHCFGTGVVEVKDEVSHAS